MDEQTKDITDYLDAMRRNRGAILGIAAALFVVSLLVTMLWPPSYRSSATILIEEQDIPEDLVRSTITSYAEQRIQIISQRVMTRSNLTDIIEKYNLYHNARRHKTTEEIIDGMRKDIKLQTISADVIDPRSGRTSQATIAFTLSFDGDTPAVAQKVANELTTLYLNENLKTRTEQAQEAYSFLSNEADRLNKQISDYEARIADFKLKNAGRLPELHDLNQQFLERTRADIDNVESEMRSVTERRYYLQGQLAQINPLMGGISASGQITPDSGMRLKALRAQYAADSARYASDHPDMVRMRKEIQALEAQVGGVDTATEQLHRLEQLRAELATAEKKYSPDHPDVIKLRKEVAALEQSLSNKPTKASSAAASNPDNPAYITLQSQLQATEGDLAALKDHEQKLKNKLSEYEQRLTQSPEVEKQYLDMTRGLQNAQAKYNEIKAKQMEADLAKQLEKESKGERFSLIDPPQLPEQPFSPNRPALLLVGAFLSISGGFGYAALKDSLDHSVRGAKSVVALLGAPPLSMIPYMDNSQDRAHKERSKRRLVIMLVAGLVLALVLVNVFWSPLDVLWFRGVRKVDTLISN